MSADERASLANACRINDEVLRQSGHLLAAERLQSSRSVTTMRIQDGQVCLTNGPFAETSEPLISLFYIDARDLNEAIRVALTMPQAHSGPIEVRPIEASLD